jgi:hypothetical protein
MKIIIFFPPSLLGQREQNFPEFFIEFFVTPESATLGNHPCPEKYRFHFTGNTESREAWVC